MKFTPQLDSRLGRTFSGTLAAHGLSLRRKRTEILRLHLGKLCNLTCIHCHVNAGPKRKEIMTRDTIDRVIDWVAGVDIHTVDLTGGAPEMIPDFSYLVERLRKMLQVRRRPDVPQHPECGLARRGLRLRLQPAARHAAKGKQTALPFGYRSRGTRGQVPSQSEIIASAAPRDTARPAVERWCEETLFPHSEPDASIADGIAS